MAKDIVDQLVDMHGLPRCPDDACVVCAAARKIEWLRRQLSLWCSIAVEQAEKIREMENDKQTAF